MRIAIWMDLFDLQNVASGNDSNEILGLCFTSYTQHGMHTHLTSSVINSTLEKRFSHSIHARQRNRKKTQCTTECGCGSMRWKRHLFDRNEEVGKTCPSHLIPMAGVSVHRAQMDKRKCHESNVTTVLTSWHQAIVWRWATLPGLIHALQLFFFSFCHCNASAQCWALITKIFWFYALFLWLNRLCCDGPLWLPLNITCLNCLSVRIFIYN